jgi:cyclopropane fatty-acyl-phospholipid synthase-like methyltransferase
MEQDVAAYYNQTQNHYQKWWQLSKGMALHYGLWHDDTKSFLEALANTNRHLAELADIKESDTVLDAGCGVGGSAIYLAKNYRAHVTGISLSDLQIQTAQENAIAGYVDELTDFAVLDYCQTGFTDNKFDVIWACESSSSAADKQKMAAEWFRLLKPGGKLVLSDFFKTNDSQKDKAELLDSWVTTWAMSPLVTTDGLVQELTRTGFKIGKIDNLTAKIYKTARRMYLSYWLGLIPSVLYNTLFGARKYARNHYKSGFYQFRALQKNLWQYKAILAIKPHLTD